METGRHFVSYIAVAVFILLYEYSNARPTMDSLFGDYVYSGAIYPISGAVPKKIHSHRQSKSQRFYLTSLFS
ncbi:hypothetical protein AVEN_5177-1 [Araneus ventricosus]|uniref:Uncharacterized protein n=1 Tax=Araneus ventricosus TaxID=182803 RepID=A0A4Y2HT88_ARAVE|nr:hypothetical protein AVEN_5177-1 [Araneus ventricosus]